AVLDGGLLGRGAAVAARVARGPHAGHDARAGPRGGLGELESGSGVAAVAHHGGRRALGAGHGPVLDVAYDRRYVVAERKLGAALRHVALRVADLERER